jgi:exodeoxyribonuclease III
VPEGSIAILTLNVYSPSVARAERQLEWLDKRDEDLFVLTETTGQSGSELLAERLRGAGWTVRAPLPRQGERGVMICSRLMVQAESPPLVDYLPERVEVVSVGDLEVIGVYAPSRDNSAERIARKRRFLAELMTVVGASDQSPRVLIGDLNVVERAQRGGGTFFEWEYELYEELPQHGWFDAYRAMHPDRFELSWVDGEGQGYRFDHAFISGDLAERVLRCEYIHETRENELSDHSAMVIEIADVASERLEVNPTLAEGPPSLF